MRNKIEFLKQDVVYHAREGCDINAIMEDLLDRAEENQTDTVELPAYLTKSGNPVLITLEN